MNDSILTSPFKELREKLGVPMVYMSKTLNLESGDYVQLEAGLAVPERRILELMKKLGFIRDVDDWEAMTKGYHDDVKDLKEKAFAAGLPMFGLSQEQETQLLSEDKAIKFSAVSSRSDSETISSGHDLSYY